MTRGTIVRDLNTGARGRVVDDLDVDPNYVWVIDPLHPIRRGHLIHVRDLRVIRAPKQNRR